MSYLKNTSSQKFNVLAVNTATGLPVTGDAANITAKISIDSAAFAAVSDTNPTELDATNAPGVYVFDLSQSETNGDVLTIVPSSSTANVQMDMLNIYTVDPATYKADVSGLATAINLGIVDGKCTSILTDTGTTIPAQITALNNFDPASDTVANVTLVGTTTNNTDMVGTDNAALATSLLITNSNVNGIKAVTDAIPDAGAMTTIATRANQITIDGKADAIKAKTDQFVFTVANQVDANALTGGGGDDAATIYTYFTAGTNEDAFKADVTALATSSSIAALNDFDPSSDTVANVTLVASNADMRGTDGANTTTPNTIVPDNAGITSIKSKTDQMVFTIANQIDANALTGGGGGGGGAGGFTLTASLVSAGGSTLTASLISDLLVAELV